MALPHPTSTTNHLRPYPACVLWRQLCAFLYVFCAALPVACTVLSLTYQYLRRCYATRFCLAKISCHSQVLVLLLSDALCVPAPPIDACAPNPAQSICCCLCMILSGTATLLLSSSRAPSTTRTALWCALCGMIACILCLPSTHAYSRPFVTPCTFVFRSCGPILF